MMMSTVQPFDQLAPGYDAEFTHSAIGKLQRSRVWSYLMPLLDKAGNPLDILEINCGTGQDAIQLAGMGHRVWATDASGAMIAEANKKIIALKEIPLQFSVCSFGELASRFSGKHFDLIFSNFGGLNCIDPAAMKKLYNDLQQLIKPGGSMMFVLMGKCCIREIMHFGIRGKLKKAFRRMGKPVDFKAGDQTMKVYYYSPGKIARFFQPGFRAIRKFPVGLFIPPSYLEKRYIGETGKLIRLNQLEKRFGYSFLSAFSDHFGIVLKKEAVTT